MGNSLGGKRRAKVMKINGETFKLKTPVQARSVLESHPGHVLLESESVRHHGARAKPLEPHHELKPKRLYFLVQLPKFPEDKSVRRVRSGIHMSAKDRLDSLMLARRSASDLSTVKSVRFEIEEERKGILETRGGGGGGGGGRGVRVTMRLPKSEVERLMAESKDGAEAAEKIVSLCMAAGGGAAAEMNAEECKRGPKLREKRVGFLPINEGDIHLAVAS
ncbi:hypothetical protein ABFX02_05G039700 [Erythranthe guttata]